MKPGDSLAEDLHIGTVDDDELRIVLSGVLPRGAQFRPGEVEYRTSNDDLAMTVRYRRGSIVDAVTGPCMTPEIARQLAEAVCHDLLSPPVESVCRWPMFSYRPVSGWWRYADRVQIAPAPPEAPRPDFLFAEHPFLVDFAFMDSPNWQVRNLRYLRRAYELELLLDLVLWGRITAASARARHRWVLLGDVEQLSSVWAQEGYVIPGLRFLVEAMPNVEDIPPLEAIAAEDYYDPWRHRGDELAVPVGIEELMAAFDCLEGETRARFLRACYWFHTAGTAWDLSQSLHLTSLVNAVECLASAERERGDAEGPTRLFKQFMKGFGPGQPSSKTIDNVYDTRSDITHGERLLHYDQPAAPGLTESSAIDRTAGDDAALLARGALLNWLWEQEPSHGGRFLDRPMAKAKAAKPGTKSSIRVVFPE